jgi:serine/threonine protein kinase
MEPIPFGNYTLLERIAHGGMAEVFRAKSFGEAGFEREVAIKLLLPSIATDEEFVTMLIDEAKIAGQLTHANIAQIFDLGVIDDRYYIVQEYVDGLDLRTLLRNLSRQGQRFSVGQACHIVMKVCEGLDYAHKKRDPDGRPLNLVHRDISPQNILISGEGEVKLIDFGIAKAEGRATKTLAGLVKGKFAYMSPEQIRGLPVDRRSDVFASGIVLHELLSNQPLFRRQSEFETLRRARAAIAEPPSHFNPDVPPELDRIVLKALARHVDDRYQTAQELRDDLWNFVHSCGCFVSRLELGAWVRGAPASAPIAPVSAPSIRIETPPEETTDEEIVENTAAGDDEEIDETIVDPPLGGGYDDSEAALVTPTDHDAQWAAAIGAPLAGDSPYSLPPRRPQNDTPTPVFSARELGKHIAATRPDEIDTTTSDRSDQRRQPAVEETTSARPESQRGADESTVNRRGGASWDSQRRLSKQRTAPSLPAARPTSNPPLRPGLGTSLGAGGAPARALSPVFNPPVPSGDPSVAFARTMSQPQALSSKFGDDQVTTPRGPKPQPRASAPLKPAPEPEPAALPERPVVAPTQPPPGAPPPHGHLQPVAAAPVSAAVANRPYLLAGALFLLFVAGAATLTLMISG